MSYFQDFPNTNFYNQDLGWLIKKYKELDGDVKVLQQIYDMIKDQIKDITIEQLQEWLDDGTLENMIMSLGKIVKYYETTEAMLNDETIQDNMTIITLGYYTINDCPRSTFYITSSQSDQSLQLQLKNGLYATFIGNKINVNQIGCKSDRTFDNYLLLQKIINAPSIKEVYFNEGEGYLISQTLNINRNDLAFIGLGKHFLEKSNVYPTLITNYALDSMININAFRIRFKNFFCFGNNKAKKGFTGKSAYLVFDSVSASSFTETAFDLNIYMSSLNNCVAGYSKVGFHIHGIRPLSLYTSTKLDTCFASDCKMGYHIELMTYSTLLDCGCDGADIAYQINSCRGIALISCGNEQCILPLKFLGENGITSQFINVINFSMISKKEDTDINYLVYISQTVGLRFSQFFINNRSTSTYDINVVDSVSQVFIDGRYITHDRVKKVDANYNIYYVNQRIVKSYTIETNGATNTFRLPLDDYINPNSNYTIRIKFNDSYNPNNYIIIAYSYIDVSTKEIVLGVNTTATDKFHLEIEFFD